MKHSARVKKWTIESFAGGVPLMLPRLTGYP